MWSMPDPFLTWSILWITWTVMIARWSYKSGRERGRKERDH